MMPVVRISDTTYQRLQSHAVPFQDSVDDVVNRALDALDGARSPDSKSTVEPIGLGDSLSPVLDAIGLGVVHPKAPRNDLPKTPQKDFRKPLLTLMVALGGSASVRTIREKMEPAVRDMLLAGDRELVSTGEERWWNATCWERNDLVKEGIFRPDSERGTWALSDAARQSLDVRPRRRLL